MNLVQTAKSWLDRIVEGGWRGPFSGVGERGGVFGLGRIDDGWQRALSVPSGLANTTASACVTAYAWSLAGVGGDHIRHLANGGIEIVRKTPASQLLRYPNDYQTSSDFWLQCISSLLYTGTTFAASVLDSRGAVGQLHLLPPYSVSPAVSPENGDVFYGIGQSEMVPINELAPERFLPARRIGHWRLHCPYHPLRGVSPLQNAAISADLGSLIQLSSRQFQGNMSRPSGILSTDMVLKTDQALRLKELWAANADDVAQGKVPILHSGLKWQPLTLSAVDSQVIQLYQMTVLDIARVYRIPPQLLGVPSDVGGTMSSTESLIDLWKSKGLMFMALHLERTLERLLKFPADEEIRFDLDALSRTGFEQQIKALTEGIQGGLYSPDEARNKIGLPDVPGGFGKEPRVQAQVVPLSQVNMTPSAPTAPAAPAAPVQAGEDKAAAEEPLEMTRLRWKAMLREKGRR